MGVILGIDIGGSSTKIVGLAPDLSVIDMLRVKADDPLTSLYGAMGNFLSTHHLQLSDIRHIALTGVGSSYVEGDIYGVKTIKVEEFPSVGVGGLALSGKEHAVVVSMGTGTSFLWANKGGEIRHLIGSGVGGGTLAGLSSLTTGVHQYALIRSLLLDETFSALSLAERTAVQQRILTEIKGRMLEDIVLLETKLANPKKQVFVLQFPVGEFDMVVFDPEAGSCRIFEIKHSKEAVPQQYRHLIDGKKCAQTEHRYGPITAKIVLYRGESQVIDGISYQNVEEYLRSLA